jgi:hypothetical protein
MAGLGRFEMHKLLKTAALAIAMAGANSASAQGIGHTFFMRGQIIGHSDGRPVVCIGKADGAKEGQEFDVYRSSIISIGSKTPSFRREKIGSVAIDHVFDDHFAHLRVISGKPAVHDDIERRSE